MSYELLFPTNSLEKKFNKKVSGAPMYIQEKVLQAIEELKNNPRFGGGHRIKPPISVVVYIAQYRKRVEDYRILYDIDDKNKIVWLLAFRGQNDKTYRSR